MGDVFAFFTEPSNDLKWRPLVTEISASESLRVGSIVNQHIKGLGGRAMPSDFEVTAFDPPSRFAAKVIHGPVRPIVDFRFTPAGDDTEVTLEISAELHGVKKLFLARPLQRAMESEVGGLDRAKAALETT